jgi:hypothetical protein
MKVDSVDRTEPTEGLDQAGGVNGCCSCHSKNGKQPRLHGGITDEPPELPNGTIRPMTCRFFSSTTGFRPALPPCESYLATVREAPTRNQCGWHVFCACSILGSKLCLVPTFAGGKQMDETWPHCEEILNAAQHNADGIAILSAVQFDGAIFEDSAGFCGTTFRGNVPVLGHITVRRRLNMDGAQFASAVRIAAGATALSCRRGRFPAGEEGPKLASLQGANAAGLALGNVSPADYRFAGAHNLDKLRLEADAVFARSPAGAGWERRQMIYYGEMEMRRHDRGIGNADKWRGVRACLPIGNSHRVGRACSSSTSKAIESPA